MRCTTWHMGKLEEGFKLVNDERFGQVVMLGERGKGKRYDAVQLGRNSPPVVKDGRVFDAVVREVCIQREGRTTSFHVLDRPVEHDYGIDYVRINTQWSYARTDGGWWEVVAGEPVELAKGWGAHGDFKHSPWDDGILALKEGDVLRVTPEGIQDIPKWAVFKLNGKVDTAPWTNFEALSKG